MQAAQESLSQDLCPMKLAGHLYCQAMNWTMMALGPPLLVQLVQKAGEKKHPFTLCGPT